MKISNFDVMKEMSSRNMDIRLSGTFVFADLVKKGGEITMGVDRKTIMDLFDNKPLILALIIVDKEQFDALKKEMEKGDL